MRKIKIFAFPSHNTEDRMSGVDFVRIVQPMEYLNGYKDDEVEFEVRIYNPKDKKENGLTTDWREIAKEYDLIYLNYTANAWAFAAMGAMFRKEGKKIVLDMDDALWNVMPDNPAYKAYQRGSEGIKNFTAICNEVDYITTTNRFLRNVITHNTRKKQPEVIVFPNRIDLDNLYTYRYGVKKTNTINLVHHGSTTHFIDLENKAFVDGVDRIMKEYPNVNLITVGSMLPSFRYKWGARYTNMYGDRDLYKWVKERFSVIMKDADIMVTPLEVNTYTKCKSSIKFLENSSTKKAGVYQRIRQYEEVIEDGVNGYLASTSDEWYNALKQLINDESHRQMVGEKAFETVEKDWQMKNCVKEYANFFKSILTNG